MKACLLSITAVLCGCAVFASAATDAAKPPASIPAESYAEVAPDGAWCWFSEPRALGLNGKTYTGWVTTDGSIQAGELDGSARPAKTFTLHEKLQRDDHDNPAFLALPDGRLAAFYCTHGNADLFLRITEKPGDFDHWTPIRKLGIGKSLTYVNPVRLAGEKDRVFLFFRGATVADWKPSLTLSTDLCQSWSKPQTLLQHVGDAKRMGGGCRPYVRYWDDGKGRIDFLFTDGHPRDEVKNRVHFMRYEKGAFWKADGTRVSIFSSNPTIPIVGVG